MKNILFLALLIFSCSNRKTNTPEFNTTKKIIKYINKNDYYMISDRIGGGLSQKKDLEGLKYYTHKSKELFDKYGIPPDSKWYVKYDTTKPIFKLLSVVVPIFKGYDDENKLEEANLIISFDYTKHYIPDTILASFELYTKYRH